MRSEIKFSVLGVNETLKVLSSLPAEIVSKKGGPVKKALFKAGKLIRDAERQALASALTIRQEKGLSTGLLLRNVVLRRGRKNNFRGERYLVKISRKKYVGRENEEKKPISTVKTAHLFEYGSVKQEPTPFIRPTFEKNKEKAFNVALKELDTEIQKVVKRLARVKR